MTTWIWSAYPKRFCWDGRRGLVTRAKTVFHISRSGVATINRSRSRITDFTARSPELTWNTGSRRSGRMILWLFRNRRKRAPGRFCKGSKARRSSTRLSDPSHVSWNLDARAWVTVSTVYTSGFHKTPDLHCCILESKAAQAFIGQFEESVKSIQPFADDISIREVDKAQRKKMEALGSIPLAKLGLVSRGHVIKLSEDWMDP